jgi:hypothetical protein
MEKALRNEIIVADCSARKELSSYPCCLYGGVGGEQRNVCNGETFISCRKLAVFYKAVQPTQRLHVVRSF